MYVVHLTGTGASGVFRTDFDYNEGVRMGPKFLSCNRSPTNFSITVNLCNKYESKVSRRSRTEDV
jgi:hypothetical protein